MGERQEIKSGSRWLKKSSPWRESARVMTVVEGYVVARFPWCMPFVTAQKDWLAEYEPAPKAGGQSDG